MQMLVVNPKRKKPRRRRKGGKRRKMSALQRRYFGGGRKTSKRRRRRRKTVALALSPAPRRVSRRRRRRGRTRSRSFGGSRMRMSFNPRSFINDTLMPAAIGAGGALALDAALSFASPYIPAALNTGIARTGVKIAGAIGIGMLAGMIGGKKLGEQAMAGAIIVTAYDFLKPYAAGIVPGVAGYNMGWVSPAMQVGTYVGSDNAYSGMMPGMGVYVGESEADYYNQYA